MDKLNQRLTMVTVQRKKLTQRVEALTSENKSLSEEAETLKQKLASTEKHFEQQRLLLMAELKELNNCLEKTEIEENNNRREKDKAHIKQGNVGKAGAAKKKILVLNMTDASARRIEDKSQKSG